MTGRSSTRQELSRLVEQMRGEGRSYVDVATAIRDRIRVNPRVALRLAHGWTQQQAADAWNQHWPDDPKTLKAISRWEVWPAATGHAPPFDVLNRLAELYRCTVSDLVADQADFRHLDNAHTISRHAQPATVPNGLAQPWELTKALTRSTYKPSIVDRFERVAQAQTVRYPRTAPEVMWPTVRLELARVNEVLTGVYSLRSHARLVRVLGILAGIAGNLAVDIGRPTTAFEYFDVSRMAGEELNDPDLTAWALALASIELYFAGDIAQAVSYLDQAAGLAAIASTGRRRAWIAALRARAHAASGHARIAMDAITEAGELLRDAEPPQGHDFFDEERLQGFMGSTHLLLGDTDAGIDHICRAIVRRPESDAKGRALLLLDKASCLVLQRDPDAACDAVHQALDTAAGQLVRPILIKTKEVGVSMARWRDTQAVAMLVERLSDTR